MRRCRGFTLIELMVTVAVVAILAAIAVPSYSEYVRRGRVTEAISTLSTMRVKMEQYYQDNRNYDGACGAPGSSVAPKPLDTASFAYLCPTHLGNNYTITATGVAGTSLEGFQYSLNQDNVRSTTMTAPSTWPSSATCWVVKKDGSC
jgi:type IV pilus assembly protein PilE